MTEEHDFKAHLQIWPSNSDNAELPHQVVRQGGRHCWEDKQLVWVSGRHRHGAVDEPETRAGGVELDIVRLKMHGCLAGTESLHDCGHELSKHGEDTGVETVEVVEGYPAASGGHAAEDVLETAVVHGLGAVKLVHRVAETVAQLLNQLKLSTVLEHTKYSLSTKTYRQKKTLLDILTFLTAMSYDLKHFL